MESLPVTIPPGVVRNGTPASVGAHWYDSHLIRWVSGRLRPIRGWEKPTYTFANGTPFIPARPIRAVHRWVDQAGQERIAVLSETQLFVIEGKTVTDISPLQELNPGDGSVRYPAGIVGPGTNPNVGGYGSWKYNKGLYDEERPARNALHKIGEVWRLGNFGEDLIAMASTDGRLLRWIPGDAHADRVKGQVTANGQQAPEGNRTFVITSERYLILFGMGGYVNKLGWCDQENIEDWNFASALNTAGFYDVEPMSRIIDAKVARYTTIFWTVQGAYVLEYKALPYIYTYNYLGAYAGPLSGQAAAVYSGVVIWPALDGFWMFDGSAVTQVPCPILDWFQQTLDDRSARAYMAGWFNGAASEIWWCFPARDTTTNNQLMVYNFEERWWSIGKLSRTCGDPGSAASYPLMAGEYQLYDHEKGYYYPDALELPWIRSGMMSPDGGKTRATTKQMQVDTDAPANVVSYEIIATKGRFATATEYTKGPKLPSVRRENEQGKIDYRITGRDFALKMAMALPGTPWSFGQGTILLAPRGAVLADPNKAA